MINRFKHYLEREFRYVEDCQESRDYREEVLGTLLDRAEECKSRGMTDEEEIFCYCIDSLGDFRSTLTAFQSKIAKAKKFALKASSRLLIGACILFGFVIGYLIISFATEAWDKTWLVLLGGIFAFVIVMLTTHAIRDLSRRSWILIRIASQVIIVLGCVFTFLCMLLIRPEGQNIVWEIFLIMVILMSGAETLISFIARRKIAFFEVQVFILLLTSLVYVIIGVNLGLWHPYWLIIVLGAGIDMFITTIYLYFIVKRNEGRPLTQKKEPFSTKTVNNEYPYWRDRSETDHSEKD